MTVREWVKQIQREVRDTDLQPGRAAELLTKLTALIGNTNDEIRQADLDYARVLLTHLETESVANRARIRAETTPEYQRKMEARHAKELVIELVRSLKAFLKNAEEEMRLTR